jgi:hypothetical protein
MGGGSCPTRCRKDLGFGIRGSLQGVELRLGIFLLACLGRDANEKWRGVLQSCRRPCLPACACLDPDILRMPLSVPHFLSLFFSPFHDVLIFEDARRHLFKLEAEARSPSSKGLHTSTGLLISTCKSKGLTGRWSTWRAASWGFDLDRPLPLFQTGNHQLRQHITPPESVKLAAVCSPSKTHDWATSDFEMNVFI